MSTQVKRLSAADWRQAVGLYVHGTKQSDIARALNVSAPRINQMLKTERWRTIQRDIENQIDSQIVGKLRKVSELAQDRVIEALEKGEEFIDSKGETHVRPVSAQVAGGILNQSFDRLRQATGKTQTSGKVDLEALAQAFVNIAREQPSPAPVNRVIEHEPGQG